MMKAAVRAGSGIQFAADVPIPTPGKGQVLLRVKATAINPVDYKLPKFVLGKVAGIDVAGVVEKSAQDVTSFAKGDEVYGFASGGSIAEWAVADASKLARKPADVSFADAAALPTAHLTSYQGLFLHGGLKKDGKVLVVGASGGCGLAACRLAKAAGASEVVGICSAGNASLVMGEGATRCVDYSDAAAMEALAAEGANFDVVYDAATGSGAGEDYVAYSARVRAKHGRTVAINGGLRKWLGALFGWQKANDKLILTKQSGKELDELVALLGGQPKPIIADHFPLSEDGVANAFKQLKSRRTRGKIIIDIA